jgi:hypothetical protein
MVREEAAAFHGEDEVGGVSSYQRRQLDGRWSE